MLACTVLTPNVQRKLYRDMAEDGTALEQRFPRIANMLSSFWQTPDIDLYLDGLLLDDRGDRMGFPMDVLDDLMFLASIRWHETHQCGRLIETTSADAFSSLGSRSELCSSNSNAWVLL